MQFLCRTIVTKLCNMNFDNRNKLSSASAFVEQFPRSRSLLSSQTIPKRSTCFPFNLRYCILYAFKETAFFIAAQSCYPRFKGLGQEVLNNTPVEIIIFNDGPTSDTRQTERIIIFSRFDLEG